MKKSGEYRRASGSADSYLALQCQGFFKDIETLPLAGLEQFAWQAPHQPCMKLGVDISESHQSSISRPGQAQLQHPSLTYINRFLSSTSFVQSKATPSSCSTAKRSSAAVGAIHLYSSREIVDISRGRTKNWMGVGECKTYPFTGHTGQPRYDATLMIIIVERTGQSRYVFAFVGTAEDVQINLLHVRNINSCQLDLHVRIAVA